MTVMKRWTEECRDRGLKIRRGKFMDGWMMSGKTKAVHSKDLPSSLYIIIISLQ